MFSLALEGGDEPTECVSEMARLGDRPKTTRDSNGHLVLEASCH